MIPDIETAFVRAVTEAMDAVERAWSASLNEKTQKQLNDAYEELRRIAIKTLIAGKEPKPAADCGDEVFYDGVYW